MEINRFEVGDDVWQHDSHESVWPGKVVYIGRRRAADGTWLQYCLCVNELLRLVEEKNDRPAVFATRKEALLHLAGEHQRRAADDLQRATRLFDLSGKVVEEEEEQEPCER